MEVRKGRKKGSYIYLNKKHVCINELKRVLFDENNDMELKDFADRYKDSLPILMKVTSGYCGANGIEFTFSSEEVYLVTHIHTQNRVILKDRVDRLLSFPDDHKLKFYTIYNGVKSEEPKQLSEILEAYALSAGDMKLMPACSDQSSIYFYVGADKSMPVIIDTFHWEASYEERYLVGNSICHERLFNVPFIIPLWMPIQIGIATGISEGTADEWEMLMRQLTKLCRDYENENTAGNKEIMLFEGKLSDYDGDYDTIAPSDYYTFSSVHKLQDTPGGSLDFSGYSSVDNSGPPPERPDPRGTAAKSQTLQGHRKAPKPPKDHKKADDKSKSQKDGEQSKHKKKFHINIKSPFKKQTSSETDGTTTPKSATPIPEGPDLNYEILDHNDSGDSDDNLYETPDQNLEVPKAKDPGYTKTKVFNIVAPSSKGGEQPVYSTTETVRCNPDINRDRPLPQQPVTHSPDVNQGRPLPAVPANADNKKSTKTPPKTKDKPSLAKKPSKKESTEKPASSEDGALSHRAPPPVPNPNTTEESVYSGYADLPKTLSGLSIKEVADCLKILKMPHHIEKFFANDVDGDLLMDIEEETLVNEFNFTKFEVTKFMKFKRGWRAKAGTEEGETSQEKK